MPQILTTTRACEPPPLGNIDPDSGAIETLNANLNEGHILLVVVGGIA